MTKDRSIILTIREYENSVDMPGAERVTYLDPRGGVHLKDGDDRSQEYTAYAGGCARNIFGSAMRWMMSPAGISPAPAQ